MDRRLVIATACLFLTGYPAASDIRHEERSVDLEFIPHFARFTEAGANRLNGQWVKCWVPIDSLPWWHEDYVLYENDSIYDVARTVWFVPGQEPNVDKPMLVTGRLEIIQHVPSVINRVWFEGFTEYRLADARIVRR